MLGGIPLYTHMTLYSARTEHLRGKAHVAVYEYFNCLQNLEGCTRRLIINWIILLSEFVYATICQAEFLLNLWRALLIPR